MAKITLNELIIPKHDQLLFDVLDHKYTYYTLCGGRGSAKSSFISIAIVLLITQHKESHAVVFRKVASTLRDSVFSQVSFAITLLGMDALFKKTTSPMEMTYKPTGQKILFRGVDEPEKIKSIKAPFGYFGITWAEELDQYYGREEIRNVLQSTMRGKGGKFWHFESFNPPISRDNWANLDIQEELPDRIVVKTSYLDVPVEWLSEQFIIDAEKLKKRKPKAYLHEYMGEAVGAGGDIFDNITARTIADDEMRRFDYLKFGLDFGFSTDPLAWVKLHYDKSKRTVYILDEIYETKMSNRAAVDRIKKKHTGSMRVIADSSEPRTINEFSNLGLLISGAKKGADSREHGYKFLQDMTEIVIDKNRTPNAYREFVSYQYPVDKHGNFISEYPKKNDHILDAVRYSLESEMIGSRIVASNQKLY